MPSSNDAATANWGIGWRMPTMAEMQDLIDNTTVTWTTQNGVYGCKFTGCNGNSIFLPAAGYRNEGILINAVSGGYYWSSSLDTSYLSNVWELYFNLSYYGVDSGYRVFGQPVRPVQD